MEFYAVIGIGSPGRTMRVIFDTSWYTSWMISNDCPIRKVGCCKLISSRDAINRVN